MLLLWSTEERKSYGTSWGWGNNGIFNTLSIYSNAVVPTYCNYIHHSIHVVPHLSLSPADSASFNCFPHLAVPMEFTHNALCQHYSSSPLPQSRLTSSLNTPRRLYIHPAILQALFVRVCFCLDIFAGLQPVCIVWWENSGSGQASGKLAVSLLFSSLDWRPKNDQSHSVHAVPWLCLCLLSIPEASLSLLFPCLPSLSHSIFSLWPSINHFFTSLSPQHNPYKAWLIYNFM